MRYCRGSSTAPRASARDETSVVLRLRAVSPVAEIVGQDLRVIEGERRGEVLLAEEAYARGIVSRLRRACGASHEDGRDGRAARVARRVGVDAEEIGQLDREGCLFTRFAARGVPDALSGIDEAAGQRPAVRRVAPPDEHDPVADLDDDVDRRERMASVTHGSGKTKKATACALAFFAAKTRIRYLRMCFENIRSAFSAAASARCAAASTRLAADSARRAASSARAAACSARVAVPVSSFFAQPAESMVSNITLATLTPIVCNRIRSPPLGPKLGWLKNRAPLGTKDWASQASPFG